MPELASVNRSGWAGNDESRKRIVDAAIGCFTKYGPQRTSMTDIADAAGISRKTLYRVFEDRSSLVEHILVQRMHAQAAKVRNRLARADEFEKLVVEASIVAVDAGRSDVLFHDIVANNTSHSVEQFLFRVNKEVFDGMCAMWFPVIERGRAQGLVREDLSNERIVEIIVNIHTLLLLREDYGPAKQRRFLKDVLLPSITGRV